MALKSREIALYGWIERLVASRLIMRWLQVRADILQRQRCDDFASNRALIISTEYLSVAC